MPGETRRLPVDPLPADATVEVVALVLDDGTAIGEESVIASIFDHRTRERNALDAVVKAFNEVLSANRGAAAVAALHERLTTLAARDPSVPCRSALDAVDAYQRKTTTGTPDDVDQSLHKYAAFVARQLEVAEKHSHRKKV